MNFLNKPSKRKSGLAFTKYDLLLLEPFKNLSYRFSHKDFGLCSQIKIRPKRTITPADNFDLAPCQNLYD